MGKHITPEPFAKLPIVRGRSGEAFPKPMRRYRRGRFAEIPIDELRVGDFCVFFTDFPEQIGRRLHSWRSWWQASLGRRFRVTLLRRGLVTVGWKILRTE